MKDEATEEKSVLIYTTMGITRKLAKDEVALSEFVALRVSYLAEKIFKRECPNAQVVSQEIEEQRFATSHRSDARFLQANEELPDVLGLVVFTRFKYLA